MQHTSKEEFIERAVTMLEHGRNYVMVFEGTVEGQQGACTIFHGDLDVALGMLFQAIRELQQVAEMRRKGN